jgi:hypothetical protein
MCVEPAFAEAVLPRDEGRELVLVEIRDVGVVDAVANHVPTIGLLDHGHAAERPAGVLPAEGEIDLPVVADRADLDH